MTDVTVDGEHPVVDVRVLAAVIDEAPTPLWVIAADGNVQLVNQAAITVLGHSTVSDLVGRPSHRTLHGHYPDGSEYPQDQCPIVGGNGPRSQTGTEWFTARSGRPLPVVWSTRRLGLTGMTLLSFEDASDRVAGEKQRSIWNSRTIARSADNLGCRSRSALRDELMRHIHKSFRDPAFSVATLAHAGHLSVRSVQVLFAEVHRAPGDEIRAARMNFAQRLLERGSTVRSACYDSGFRDPGTFARAFRRHFGDSPTGYRQRLTASARTSAE